MIETKIMPNLRMETSIIYQRLAGGHVGDIVTDEELTALCGNDTRTGGKAYGCLQSAMRQALKKNNLVWKRIIGANALKCLGPTEVVETVHSNRHSICRKAKTAVQKLHAVAQVANCGTQEKMSLTMAAAHLGSIAILSSNATQKKMEARTITQELDMNKMLEAMNDHAT